MTGIFTEGNKARKRGDKGTRTADIYAPEQFGIVGSELRQKNGARNVAYYLTGQGAEEQSVDFEKGGKRIFDNADSGHISCKYEHTDKGH